MDPISLTAMAGTVSTILNLASRAYDAAKNAKDLNTQELVLELREQTLALREEQLALREAPLAQGEEILALKSRNLELAQQVANLELDLKKAFAKIDNQGDEFLVFGRFHFLVSDGPGRRPLCPKCRVIRMGALFRNGDPMFNCEACNLTFIIEQDTHEDVFDEAERIGNELLAGVTAR